MRQELWALIDQLRSEGVSILMSTHYIEEAARLADTVTIMAKGSAVASGPPAQLVTEHAGSEAVEVYGPPAKLAEVEAEASRSGLRTRRTGTSVSILGADGANGLSSAGERRPANLEDVFVLLTGEARIASYVRWNLYFTNVPNMPGNALEKRTAVATVPVPTNST